MLYNNCIVCYSFVLSINSSVLDMGVTFPVPMFSVMQTFVNLG